MPFPFSQSIEWGIFSKDGGPVLIPDSVFGIEFAKDFRLSDYPIEGGGFESYNKVRVPWETKIQFLVGGINQPRSDFLQDLEAAVESLDLYVVVTPEISYVNANIKHYGLRRQSHKGVTLLLIDVWLEEVRIVNTGQLSNTQSTNGQSPGNNGPVSTEAPKPWQQAITQSPPT